MGLKRLPTKHPIYPVLKDHYHATEAGIAGEKRVETIFRNHSFAINHRIFHDLSLKTTSHFQMDHVFFAQGFFHMFETKNISGTLTFRENPPQLIREKRDGEIESFENPVVQLERNVDLFQDWLRQRNIHIPVIGAVVLASPKQIVKVPPKNTKLLVPNAIPRLIKDLYHLPSKIKLSILNRLTTELLKNHQEFIPRPLSISYSIPAKDFIPGVECQKCGYLGMIKIPRNWHCPKCKKRDPKAHEQAIRDWFLLIGREMSNQDCREFLLIDDIHQAKRILTSMDLVVKGGFRDRVYQYDFLKNGVGL